MLLSKHSPNVIVIVVTIIKTFTVHAPIHKKGPI